MCVYSSEQLGICHGFVLFSISNKILILKPFFNSMKQKITLFLFVALVSVVILSGYKSGAANNNGTDGTGAEGTGTGVGCGNVGCHGSTSANAVTVELDSLGTAVTSYVAGGTYTVKITATNGTGTTLPKFGFQLATVLASSAGTSSAAQAGTWGTTLPANVQNTSASTSSLSIPIIEQTRAITATSGTGANGTVYTEIIPWTAPVAGTGSVAIYGVVNTVNGDGNATQADKYQQATPVTITEATSCPTVTVSISGTGHALTASATGATGYQWYLNGNMINGATSSTYTATTSGAYTVVATVSGGCSGTSSAYNFSTVGINDLSLSEVVQVYPRVTASSVNVKINSSVGTLNYNIYGLDGRRFDTGTIAAGTNNTTIDMNHLSTGIYLISIADQSRTTTYKIVKQ